MENTERSVKKGFNLSSFLLGAIATFSTITGIEYLISHPIEKPKITRTSYQDYQVKLNQYTDRTVVIMENTKTPVKIHGEDRSNDGSIDFSENIMGYPGTGNDQKVLQEAYDALRKR